MAYVSAEIEKGDGFAEGGAGRGARKHTLCRSRPRGAENGRARRITT